jgi:hypothetical protein
LCLGCTLPLLEPAGDFQQADLDQRSSAGFDAVTWAERIAPSRWGHAVDGEPWVDVVRCLAFAAVVTGRGDGCPHTADRGAAVPVIAVARAPGVLRCPACAEHVVARHTTTGQPCDRCRSVAVDPRHRVAALTGASLIIAAQLCDACASHVLAFADLDPSTL